MAITIKHAAPGLLGDFAAGQARGTARQLKYAQDLMQPQQELGQRQKYGLMDQQGRNNQQFNEPQANAIKELGKLGDSRTSACTIPWERVTCYKDC